MEFAIVKFVEEDDSPGIIATNWLNPEENKCLFPNVRNEGTKNKLLIARETPGSNWLECKVKVLKKFANYHAARSLLTEAEDTSNLESGTEFKPRKRKRKVIRLPGEDSTSDEDDIAPKTIKYSYPVPPTPNSPHNILNLNKNLNTYSSYSPLKSSRSNQTYAATLGCSGQPLRSMSSNFMKNLNQGLNNETDLESSQSNETYAAFPSYSGQPIRSVGSNFMKNFNQGLNNEIEQNKLNQKIIWSVLTEFKEKTQQIENKLDRVLTFMEDIKNNSQILHTNVQNEEMNLMSSLPVGMENFSKLNETIAANSSFKQRLMKILNVVGGRDGKALIANVLRKLISDDVGEKFSLTGKCTKNSKKSSFENTEIYKLIVEISFRTLKWKENQVREVISDWLMQSKFRKNRREKRRNIQEECRDEEIIEYVG